MTGSRYRSRIETLLTEADIRLDGERPWDVRILNEQTFSRVAADGMLGVGEAYMDGWWECDQLDEMICRAIRANFRALIRPITDMFDLYQARLLNPQKKARAFQVGKRHYDLGDDLYRSMLDPRMIYSCGYWKNAHTLAEAQEHKLELIARKLGFEPGMKVLDIGCGWGGALKYFAEKYGISGVGITISRDQFKTANELCLELPIEIRLEDYRALDEPFDRVFSVGMLEHVGYKNYPTYMQIVRRCLAPEGLFLLHTIGGRRSVIKTDPWLARYIFPNSMLPSAKQITAAAEDQLVIEDWHNFRQDYDRTLMCWYENFSRAWGELKARYDDRFFRMWRYYLLSSAGGFRSGANQLWQIVLSRDGIVGGYRPADDIR